MELAQVSGVHGFITEHAVYGEIFLGLEAAFLIGQLVQHLRADGCCVSAEEILHGLFLLENTSVSDRSESTSLVGFLDDLQIGPSD
jgi:hypothetical protein